MSDAAMSSLFEEGLGINGFVALANAAQYGRIRRIWSAAQAAMSVAARSSASLWLFACSEQDDIVWRREHLLEILEEDEASDTLAGEYLALTSRALGHNSGTVSVPEFLTALTDWADAGLDHTSEWVSIYKHTWKFDHAYRVLGLTLYAPFVMMLLEPDLTPSSLETIDDALDGALEDGPITLADLQAELVRDNVSASEDFLHFVSLNRLDLITLCEEDIVIDRLHRAFPAAHLARHVLIRDRYLSISANRWSHAENPLRVDVALDAGALFNFFTRWSRTDDFRAVSWEEIATKIWAQSGPCCQLIQGLPVPVGEAMAEVLQRESRVLSRADLTRLIGADRLHLEPEELGPGRILAYIPGPRFASANTCLYVLKEWVQDAEHSRNRISSTRVITPLHVKDTTFTPAQCHAVLALDQEFSILGVTTSRRVAHALARRMPSKPIEPYYLNKIAGKLGEQLGSNVRSLDGLLVDDRWDQIVAVHDKAPRQRALIVRYLRSIASNPIDSERRSAAAILVAELKARAHR